MARDSEAGEASLLPPAQPPDVPSVRIRRRSDPLLIVCRCFSFLTAIIAVLCVFVNVLSAIQSFKNGSDVSAAHQTNPRSFLPHPSSSSSINLTTSVVPLFLGGKKQQKFRKIFGGIFRCYAVVISLFVAVAETEWSFIMKFWQILGYWAGRGMLQIFVAVMTRAFPDVSWQRKDLILLQEIASYLLMACGLTYVISGVLCIGFLKRARQQKEVTREQAVRDLEELERRREELEALLVVDNA